MRITHFVLVMWLGAPAGMAQKPHNGALADMVGVVQTHAGKPIPLAMVSVRLDGNEAAPARGWHDQVLKTDPQGTFRLRVPGGQDYRVCVAVPGQKEHCQYATVHGADLATLHFVFQGVD